MAFTLAQKQALEAALAAGVTSVSYEGKSTTYRSLAEMRQILAAINSDLAGTVPTRQFRVTTRKAY